MDASPRNSSQRNDSLRTERARTFSSVAEVYERTRPGYPERAVQWLVPGGRRRVLELGAGTGKLTETLLAQGHDIVAVDPSGPMLDQLEARLDVRAVQASAELLPFRAGSFDTVIVGQAFHWFDDALAVPEIARVLAEDGELALIWNLRDEAIPWVRKLSEIIGGEDTEFAWMKDNALVTSGLFGPLQTKSLGFWQLLDLDGLLGLVRSRSYVAALDQASRDDLLDRVRDLYNSYERGPDGLRLRYATRCFRTRVDKTALPPDQIEPPGGGDLLFDFR